MRDYLDAADDEILTIITIEHEDALAHIDEVLATPGIDVAVIGPGDLATSMRLRGRTDDPGFLARWRPAPTPAKANELIARGYCFIGVGVDSLLLQRGIAGSIEGVDYGQTRPSAAIHFRGSPPMYKRSSCSGRPGASAGSVIAMRP
jgi:4-hydroxy-2-oxoheptanedioate aldolase